VVVNVPAAIIIFVVVDVAVVIVIIFFVVNVFAVVLMIIFVVGYAVVAVFENSSLVFKRGIKTTLYDRLLLLKNAAKEKNSKKNDKKRKICFSENVKNNSNFCQNSDLHETRVILMKKMSLVFRLGKQTK